jgi:beta-glucosidase
LHQKYRWLVEQPANNPTKTTFSGVTYPVQVPCPPTVVYTDGPDGVRFTDGVTAFPAQIALVSTWSTRLAFRKGAAQGAEAFDKQKNVVLGPGLASGRTPLSGRTPEYLGEDQVLGGLLAAGHIRGLEDGNPGKPALSASSTTLPTSRSSTAP